MDQSILQVVFVLALCAIQSTTSMETCKGVKLGDPKEADKSMGFCIEKAGETGKSLDKIPPEKMPCIEKCIFQRNGMLDDAGKPNKENILKITKLQLPQFVHETWSLRLDKCLSSSNVIDNIDIKETLCMSYIPLFMCITTGITEICAD